VSAQARIVNMTAGSLEFLDVVSQHPDFMYNVSMIRTYSALSRFEKGGGGRAQHSFLRTTRKCSKGGGSPILKQRVCGPH
jgi:hypothetical protein